MIPMTREQYFIKYGYDIRADNMPVALQETEAGDCMLPKRAPAAHKYSFGRALVIAGSRGFSGAPVLAANACERGGAGLTTLLVPDAIYAVAAAKCDGAVVSPVPSDASGAFSGEAAEEVLPVLAKSGACVIGPGMRASDGQVRLLGEVLRNARCPVVLDADAITICASHPEFLQLCEAPLLLTPHEGEFARLAGHPVKDRVYEALAFSRKYPGTVLVLKGAGTLVCADGSLFVNPTGGPAMAKGGSGDVLCGILCALLAQGFEPVRAARTAVYIHGMAGDIAAGEKGEYSVIPSDITGCVPRAMKDLITE